MSVRPSAWKTSAPTSRIYTKFDIWGFFEILFRHFEVSLKSHKNKWYFTRDLSRFMIVSSSVILRIRNVSDNRCLENRNTYCYFFLNQAFMKWCGKVWYSQAGHIWQHDACTWHAGYTSLQTQTQNMYYLLIFHCNNCCTHAPQGYVIVGCLSCFVQIGFIYYALPIIPIITTHNHFSSST